LTVADIERANKNGNGNDAGDQSKEKGLFTQANPKEKRDKQFEELEYLLDSPRSPDRHEAREKVNERFKEDIFHRVHMLELEMLKYKRQALS
jgi:hypothetical protein